TFQLSLAPQKYEEQAGLKMLDHFRDETRSIPGVENAAYANGAPLVSTTSQSFYRMEENMHDLRALHEAVMNMTTPEYLDTMKITLVRGRFLNQGDRADTPRAA